MIYLMERSSPSSTNLVGRLVWLQLFLGPLFLPAVVVPLNVQQKSLDALPRDEVAEGALEGGVCVHVGVVVEFGEGGELAVGALQQRAHLHSLTGSLLRNGQF